MEKTNERQYNLDLLKALAIISMVLCHPVLMMGRYRIGYESEFLYLFADAILGGYVVVAHGFMFSMGVGMVYSRKNSPADLVGRGIRLLIMGYVLNYLRYGMYYMAYDIINDVQSANTLWFLIGGDILLFAGLAFIVTGILKKLNLKAIYILGIGLILSMVGTMIAFTCTGNDAADMILGLFYNTGSGKATFNLCSWYIFVAVGILFGKILKETKDKDRLYKGLLIVSGIIMIIYIIGAVVFGPYFLSKQQAFYSASPLDALGLLSIDLFILSLFYFLLKKVDVSRFKLFIEMSKNITSIYCIHWCILGPTEFFCCYVFGIAFGYPFMYIYAIVLLIVSFLLARLYKSLKKKYIEAHS